MANHSGKLISGYLSDYLAVSEWQISTASDFSEGNDVFRKVLEKAAEVDGSLGETEVTGHRPKSQHFASNFPELKQLEPGVGWGGVGW